MKPFLLAGAALLITFGAHAQESLFPELQGNTAQPQSEEPQPTTQNLNQPVGETVNQGVEGQTTQNSGNLIVRISDVTIVVPPVKKMQFCTGALTLENQTKEAVETLEIEVTYGPLRMPYTFYGVNSGQTLRGNIALAGEACQSLTKSAPIKVTNCVVGDWTLSECQGRIKYQLPQ